MKLALTLVAAITACAPAHANTVANLAIEMCSNLTEFVMVYHEGTGTRGQANMMVDYAVSEPRIREIARGMLDIADEGHDAMFIEVEAKTYCIGQAIEIIEAAQ